MMRRVYSICVLLSCATTLPAYAGIGERWEVVGPSPFDGREEMQFAEFDGRLWATGGRDLECDYVDEICWEVIYDDLWVSDDAKEWRLVLEHAPFGTTWQRYDSELFAFADHLYFMSGIRRNEDDSLPSEVIYWRSKDGLHWETITDTTDYEVTSFRERVAFKGRLHILGTGYSTADGVSWDYSDAYSPPPFVTSAGAISAVAHGDYIYVYAPQQRVWRSPDGFQWTELEGSTDIPVLRWSEWKLLSFGGYLWVAGDFLSEAKVFRSLDGENWYSECSFQCPVWYGGIATLRERLYVQDYWWSNLAISLPCADYLGASHSSDRSRCGSIGLSELLRVVQLYAFGDYHCDAGSEDGYAPGPGDQGAVEGETGGLEGAVEGESTPCLPHSSDYAPEDGRISLNELLRLVQLYNAGDYRPCGDEELTEDGFCLGRLTH